MQSVYGDGDIKPKISPDSWASRSSPGTESTSGGFFSVRCDSGHRKTELKQMLANCLSLRHTCVVLAVRSVSEAPVATLDGQRDALGIPRRLILRLLCESDTRTTVELRPHHKVFQVEESLTRCDHQ